MKSNDESLSAAAVVRRDSPAESHILRGMLLLMTSQQTTNYE